MKGFIECLDIETFKGITFTSGHTGEIIYAKVCGAIGLFIVEESQWGSRGGLGKKMVVGVYRNGKTSKQKFQFIDQYDARRDNDKIKFEKLDIASVYYDRIYLKAYTKNEDHSILCFEITGNEKEKNEKEKHFDLYIKKGIKKIKEKYQENFPKLYVKIEYINYFTYEAKCTLILDPEKPHDLTSRTPNSLSI